MNILVCVKRVPLTGGKITLSRNHKEERPSKLSALRYAIFFRSSSLTLRFMCRSFLTPTSPLQRARAGT